MPVHLTCSTCGALVSRKPSAVYPSNYCSKKCQYNRGAEASIKISPDGLTASVPLYGRDGSIRAYTKIDASDIPFVSPWRWSLDSTGYAQRGKTVGGKNAGMIKLHRDILGITGDPSLYGDHINRDRLDNRRANLRSVPRGRNGQNVPSYQGSTSKHRGVSWNKRAKKWIARVKLNGRHHHVGYFSSEDEAAQAAKAVRLSLLPYAVD